MIAAFKARYPNSFLAVMVTPAAAGLLRSNPAVDKVMTIDKKGTHRGFLGMLRLINEIRKNKFQVLLSPHKSHRTGLLALLSGIPLRCGYKSADLSWAYHHKFIRNQEHPEIHRLLEFLKDFSQLIKPEKTPAKDPDQLLLYETEDSRMESRKIMSELMQPRSPILLGASSVWPTKRWTTRGFAELAGKLVEKFKTPVLLIGSPADFEISEDVVVLAREIYPPRIHEQIVNVCGKTSLMGLFSLMKQSRLLVSNDSAPIHFGCAAQIPVVAIFGPTVKELGYAPIAPRTLVVEKTGMECRPCGTHGAKVCPLAHFRCMKDLTSEEVLLGVSKVLA